MQFVSLFLTYGCRDQVTLQEQRSSAIRSAHSRHFRHPIRRLFAGLEQRAVLSCALQQFQKAKHTGGKKYNV